MGILVTNYFRFFVFFFGCKQLVFHATHVFNSLTLFGLAEVGTEPSPSLDTTVSEGRGEGDNNPFEDFADNARDVAIVEDAEVTVGSTLEVLVVLLFSSYFIAYDDVKSEP